MDPLSITGFSFQLVGTVGKLSKLLYDFYQGGKELPQRIIRFQSQLRLFQASVRSVEHFFGNNDFYVAAIEFEHVYCSGTTLELLETLKTCSTGISQFSQEIEKHLPKDGEGIIRRGWTAYKLEESDIDELGTSLQSGISCIQLHLQCLQAGLQVQSQKAESDTSQLEAENASLRESVETLKAQYKTHERSITKSSTTQHHKLLNDMQHAKEVSPKVRDVVMKEIARRKALQSAAEVAQVASSQGTVINAHPYPLYSTHYQDDVQDNERALSADEFDTAVAQITQQQQASNGEPFSDDEVDEVSSLLRRVGKEKWAAAPRTYLVLRTIDQIGAMSDFLLEGRKDAHFPYTDRSLPECLDKKARRTFMQNQNLVFSQQHVDIVKGGSHLYLGQSADTLFNVLGRLGKGGYGTVDHVQSKLTRENYARKKFSRQHTFRTPKTTMQQYENEINALKKYSHEHLPVAEMNLTEFLEKSMFTAEDHGFLLRSLGCLCSAVLYLHENKCRHKDIKPDNILVHEGSMLLTDFGIAMDWADGGGETTIGTARAYSHGYAAPEVHLAKPRKRYTDVWSLGCVFLELIAVVLGESPKTRELFLQRHGTQSIRPGVNVAGLQEWLAHLRSLRSEHDQVLHWIESMTAEDPMLRPEATKLMKQIMTASKTEQSYCGDCCLDDSESSDFDPSGSDAEDVEHSQLDKPCFVEERTLRPLEDRIRRPYGSQAFVENAPAQNKVPDLPVETGTSNVESQRDTNADLDQRVTVPTEMGSKAATAMKALPALSCPVPETPATRESHSPIKHHTSSRRESSRARKVAAKARQGSILLPVEESSKLDERPSPEKPNPNAMFTIRPTVLGIPDNLQPVWLQSETDAQAIHNDQEELELKISQIQEVFNEDSSELGALVDDLHELVPLSWTTELLDQVEVTGQSTRLNSWLHTAIEAVSEGLDRTLLQRLILAGADPNIQNVFGNSPLHVATAMRNPTWVKYLLRSGADGHSVNLTGLTPLHLAARECDAASVRILLRADKDMVGFIENDGWTALHYACRYASWDDKNAVDDDSFETIRLLLESGADTDAREAGNRTPISFCHESIREEVEGMFHREHEARIEQNEESSAPPPAYESVVNQGDEIDSTGPCDCEILQVAKLLDEVNTRDGEPLIQCHCSECLEDLADELYLLMGWTNECTCRFCEQSRMLQCVYDETEKTCQCEKCRPAGYVGHEYYDAKIEDAWNSLQNIDQARARDVLYRAGYNAAHMSRYSSDVHEAWIWAMDNIDNVECPENVAALLISLGADASKLGREKVTMLHLAASRGWLTLASVLLNSGADANTHKNSMFSGKRMFSPLIFAVWSGHADMVRLLLRAGASLDARTSTGMTALHYAVMSQNEEVTTTLLAHDPDLDALDSDECIPLQLAVREGNILAARVLIEAGANFELETKSAPTALLYAIQWKQAHMVEVLLNYGANVYAGVGNAPCALIRAAQIGDGQIIRLLLTIPDVQQNVNVAEAGTGRTALHLIADKAHDDIIIAEEALISAGANVNATDTVWSTPLHAAAKAGSAYYTTRLMYAGTDAGWRNADGKTALDIAIKKGHREVVEVLGGRLEKKKKWYRLS